MTVLTKRTVWVRPRQLAPGRVADLTDEERANVKAIAQGVGRLSAHAVDMQAAMSRRQIEKLMAKP